MDMTPTMSKKLAIFERVPNTIEGAAHDVKQASHSANQAAHKLAKVANDAMSLSDLAWADELKALSEKVSELSRRIDLHIEEIEQQKGPAQGRYNSYFRKCQKICGGKEQ